MSHVGVRRVMCCAFVLFGAACGDDTSGAGGAGGSGGAATTTATGSGGSGGAAAVGDDVVRLAITTRVEPGAEVQLCTYRAMPADRGELAARRASHVYTDGSHHFLAFRTDLAAIPEGGDELRPCDESSWMSHVRGLAYGAQSPEGELTLPDGVSQRFAPGEVILLQTHYVNPTAEALDASIQLDFDLVSPESAPIEAGAFFFFNPVIHVPPHASSTSQLACPIDAPIDLVFAVSHMHARGTGYRAHLQGQPEGSIYENDQWEEPEPRRFEEGDPAAHVPAGSWLEYACDYTNDGEDIYRAGPDASDEMCMFFGMYYPRQDRATEMCWNGLAVTQGSTSCLDTIACSRDCEGDDACIASCVDQVCPNGAVSLMRFSQCVSPACGDVCDGSDAAACTQCALTACPEEAAACQAASCEPG